MTWKVNGGKGLMGMWILQLGHFCAGINTGTRGTYKFSRKNDPVDFDNPLETLAMTQFQDIDVFCRKRRFGQNSFEVIILLPKSNNLPP